MKIKVSDVVASFLREKEIRHVFGIIGSANAHIFDSIQNAAFTEIVCTHHEQAACMAMQTYYRITGRATITLLTAGAGSSNGITGVMSAWADSIPGIIISGNENAKHCNSANPLRMWGIQGYDSVAMARPITKYGVRVLDPTHILFELEKAYHISTHGRPGPCWIDVPLNIQSSFVEESDLVRFAPETLGETASRLRPDEATLTRLAERLLQAQKPLLWLGQGIRLAGAADKVPALFERLGVPALLTWSGIDLADSGHPLVYGRAGVYGQRASNLILQNCDFLLAIGTRLAIPQVGYDIEELCRGAEVAVVDIDRAELDKYASRYTFAVEADAGAFLEDLLQYVGPTPRRAPAPWIAYCDAARDAFPRVGPEHADRDGFINSYAFMKRLEPHFKKDQVIVTDMGTALLSGHQVIHLKAGQRLMTSLGLGEMGFGLPGVRRAVQN